MIDWTELENRLQAHRTTTDRINRQAWHRYADRSGDRFASGASARLKPSIPATLRRASGLCRAAGRLLAVPLHRGAQPS